MRRCFLYLIIIGTCLFLSCNWQKKGSGALPIELVQAENIMYENPDSALRILQSMEIPVEEEAHATWALFLTQARYKCFMEQSDSLVNIAYDYYLKGNDSKRRALALYLKGGLLYDTNQYENALKYYLEADKEVNEIYEVVAGDTLSGIVEKVNIPMDKIIELNDAIKDERSTLHIGQEIIITVPEPELSVVRTEQQYLEEAYDAEVVYIDNDEWYTTQEKTLQEPSTGFRKAVANVTYRNDKEISKEVVKEVVLMEAVPKIVERGTKIPPTFIKPISGGRLTSRFGRRTSPTRGASSNHKGVDWGIPRGSSVVASSGGTVTKAGWGGGYGYVVYIKHPGGAETRYAHLNKVLVSAGQTVKQGQKIALTGNTGVSTGPHLHFELRLNGTPVDPYAYMN